MPYTLMLACWMFLISEPDDLHFDSRRPAPLHACLYIQNASMPYMTCLGRFLSSSFPVGSTILGDAIFGQTDLPFHCSGMVSSPILETTCKCKGFTTSKCDAHALPAGTAYEHLKCIQLVHQQQGTSSNAFAPGHKLHSVWLTALPYWITFFLFRHGSQKEFVGGVQR